MKPTKNTNVSSNNICVDLNGLMTLLCCGRATAEKIGKESNACFKVGRRKFYKMDKVNTYLESLTEKM